MPLILYDDWNAGPINGIMLTTRKVDTKVLRSQKPLPFVAQRESSRSTKNWLRLISEKRMCTRLAPKRLWKRRNDRYLRSAPRTIYTEGERRQVPTMASEYAAMHKRFSLLDAQLTKVLRTRSRKQTGVLTKEETFARDWQMVVTINETSVASGSSHASLLYVIMNASVLGLINFAKLKRSNSRLLHVLIWDTLRSYWYNFYLFMFIVNMIMMAAMFFTGSKWTGECLRDH